MERVIYARSILVHPLTREEASYIICPASNANDTIAYSEGSCAYSIFEHRSRVYNSDHETRNAWIGPPFPLDLDALPLRSEDLPLQYPSLSEPAILSLPDKPPDLFKIFRARLLVRSGYFHT